MTLDPTRPAGDARSPYARTIQPKISTILVAFARLNTRRRLARGTEGTMRMDLEIVLCVIGESVLSVNYMQAGTASGCLAVG